MRQFRGLGQALGPDFVRPVDGVLDFLAEFGDFPGRYAAARGGAAGVGRGLERFRDVVQDAGGDEQVALDLDPVESFGDIGHGERHLGDALNVADERHVFFFFQVFGDVPETLPDGLPGEVQPDVDYALA